ncbi:MAG: FtsX-like permease family protein, partial [Kangiellaceae bacterium]
SAVIGTLIAIRNAANLPPAEAMRPASPPVYKKTFLEKLGLHRRLSFLSRIVLRQLERRPFRSMLSAIGMSMASAILVFSLFLEDSMTHLVNVQYELTQREDLNLTFVEPRPKKALEEIRSLPGVLKTEAFRDVPANLIFKHYQKRGAITGLGTDPDLRRVIDENLAAVTLPEKGLVLGAKLAEILHIKVGEILTVEVLEGKRPTLQIPVVALTQEYIGTGAYININSLNQLLDEAPKISGVSVQIDDNYAAVLFKQLKQIPQIVGLNIVSVLRRIFDEIMAENLLKMVTTNIFFASIISFGVIYNTARIALSERARELASLRVLGLTRKEVAYILFGELGFIALVSLPIGLWFGIILSKAMSSALETELFRIPLYINNSTYGYSVLVVLISALISFYLVWRQVESIDLVSAQKGVE